MQVASGKLQYNIWLRELADVSNKHENLVTTPWGPQADIKMMIISLVKNLREFSLNMFHGNICRITSKKKNN